MKESPIPLRILLSLLTIMMLYPALGFGAEINVSSESNPEAKQTNLVSNIKSDNNYENERESLFPQKSLSLALSHFTWGADLGSSIDLGANNMSTFDIDVNFGYKNNFIRFVGFGGGIHKSFGASNTFIPVYVLFRSSFREKPSLFFFNLKAGYSFNTIADSPTYGDISASIGLGINLALSPGFRSHIIIGYGFRHFSNRHKIQTGIGIQNANLAQLSFGVNF